MKGVALPVTSVGQLLITCVWLFCVTYFETTVTRCQLVVHLSDIAAGFLGRIVFYRRNGFVLFRMRMLAASMICMVKVSFVNLDGLRNRTYL
jgi:hypothetical protein